MDECIDVFLLAPKIAPLYPAPVVELLPMLSEVVPMSLPAKKGSQKVGRRCELGPRHWLIRELDLGPHGSHLEVAKEPTHFESWQVMGEDQGLQV